MDRQEGKRQPGQMGSLPCATPAWHRGGKRAADKEETAPRSHSSWPGSKLEASLPSPQANFLLQYVTLPPCEEEQDFTENVLTAVAQRV